MTVRVLTKFIFNDKQSLIAYPNVTFFFILLRLRVPYGKYLSPPLTIIL